MALIAEMIAGYGAKQQSQKANVAWAAIAGSWSASWGDSLAMKSIPAGNTRSALPVIENTMRSASQKIQAGDFTGGYAEAVGGLPLMSQNPLIAQASKSYLDSIKGVAEFQQNQMWNDLQRSRMGGGNYTGHYSCDAGPSAQ